MTEETNLERIERFAEYEHNWNGYGATPFEPSTIYWAKCLLDALENGKLFVAPIANNRIQFEWESPDGNYFEIECCHDGYTCSFLYTKDNKAAPEPHIYP